MSRLQSEWQRLYLPGPSPDIAMPAASPGLIDAQGRIRAMVLALGRPADWPALSAVWQGVQTELGLPAPGIAVSGTDSYELWFSLREAVPVSQAHAFLEGLRARHLVHVAPMRIGLLPAVGTDGTHQPWHAGMLPGHEVRDGQWSAFVAPDLAPMFAETPWLDVAPSPEGQAELLSRLQSIEPAQWQAARSMLDEHAHADATTQAPASTQPGNTARYQDPRRFLIDVMNDETIAMALRIEAAKALLPHA